MVPEGWNDTLFIFAKAPQVTNGCGLARLDTLIPLEAKAIVHTLGHNGVFEITRRLDSSLDVG